MALKDRIIEIAYKLKDQFTAGTKKITGSMSKVETASDKAALKIEANNKRAAGSFGLISKGITPVRVAFVALGAAIAGIISSINTWTTAAAKQERAETKLATSLRNLTGASDEQISALYDQASALQRVTGYGDEATISAQAMLATFKLTAGQIQQLTPALLDMAESARKAGKEEVDLESISIALGKAFTSGIGSLSRYGIAMSDTQKEAFKLADQQEKVNILTEILADNFGGLAAAVGKEYDGAMRKADAAQGDYLETLGKVFTENEAWKKLIGEVQKIWESLAKGISGSGKEIGSAITKIAQGITVFFAGIKTAFNVAQIVIKSASVAVAESVAFILSAMSKVTFFSLSKRLERESKEIKQYAREMREGISDDFQDIEDAATSVSEAFTEIEKPAEEAAKKIKVLGGEADEAADNFEQLDRSAKLLNDSLDDAASKYERDAKALQDAKKSARDLREEFSALTDEMRNGIKEAGDLSVLDVQNEITKANQALGQGDEERALEGARKAGELLRKMKEEGKESDIVLTGMAMRLEQLAAGITDASTKDELFQADRSKAALDELIAKKQDLAQGPIDLTIRVDDTQLRNLNIPKEVVIPVRYEVVGGVPTYQQGSDDVIARESRKRGTRPQ